MSGLHEEVTETGMMKYLVVLHNPQGLAYHLTRDKDHMLRALFSAKEKGQRALGFQVIDGELVEVMQTFI